MIYSSSSSVVLLHSLVKSSSRKHSGNHQEYVRFTTDLPSLHTARPAYGANMCWFSRSTEVISSVVPTFLFSCDTSVSKTGIAEEKILTSCNSAWVYTIASMNSWYSLNSGDTAEQGGIKQELQERKYVVFILHWKIHHANQIQAPKQVEARIKSWVRRKSICFHRNFVTPIICSSLICGHLIWIYARIMIPLWFTLSVNSAVNNEKEVWNYGGINRKLKVLSGVRQIMRFFSVKLTIFSQVEGIRKNYLP